jgi:hypothetical protein
MSSGSWNYSAIHFTGRATVHRDPEWLLNAVTALSNQHEQSREKRWAVTDAPDGFIAQQLRAIVGIELVIERIEAKAKRSQNRPLLDREEVINGLRTTGGHRERAMAEQMERDPHTRGVSLARCHRGRDQGADDVSPRPDGQGRAITQVCLERRVVDGLLNAPLLRRRNSVEGALQDKSVHDRRQFRLARAVKLPCTSRAMSSHAESSGGLASN